MLHNMVSDVQLSLPQGRSLIPFQLAEREGEGERKKGRGEGKE